MVAPSSGATALPTTGLNSISRRRSRAATTSAPSDRGEREAEGVTVRRYPAGEINLTQPRLDEVLHNVIAAVVHEAQLRGNDGKRHLVTDSLVDLDLTGRNCSGVSQ